MIETRRAQVTERVITERKGHITDMVLPKGGLRIIYGRHDRPTDAADIPVNTKGIFLEVCNPSINKDEFAEDFAGNIQYSSVIEYAGKNGVPVYFHDIGVGDRYDFLFDHLKMAKLAEPLAIIPIFASSNSVREGLLLSAPVIYDSIGLDWAMLLTTYIKDEDRGAWFTRQIMRTHPYTFPIAARLRNAVWAEKINWAMENIAENGDHFTTIVGGAHVGLEKYVRKVSGGKQPKILGATSSLWARIGDLPPFYSITRFVPDPSTGEFELDKVFEVPALKDLALRTGRKRQ